jgi:hypothetical protein
MRNRSFLFIFIIGFMLSCQSIKSGDTERTRIDANSSNLPKIEETGYRPTQVTYDRVFMRVEAVVNELNSVVREKDYARWLTYLSDEYIEEKSDPAFLRELSHQPALVMKRIELKSLKDFFNYVIVPSRVFAKLEKIVFLNEKKVMAMSTLYGQQVILYTLEKNTESWKICNSK